MAPAGHRPDPEPGPALGRLEAMGLRATRAGWVPEPPEPPSPPGRIDPTVVASQPSSRADSTDVPAAGPAVDVLLRGWAKDRLPPWAHGAVDRIRAGSVVAAVAVFAALVVCVVLVLHHGSGAGSGSSYAGAYDASAAGGAPNTGTPLQSLSSAPAAAADATSIVVDVGGRVRKPGLVTLPQGARVADALAAAGGPLRRKEVATLDLAARVSDGQLLLIGVRGAAGDGSGATASAPDGSADGLGSPTSSPVSLSSATLDQLETLPGVGPATAQKIIDWRTANNGFTTVAQLQQVPGIGPVKYSELSPLVTP